MAEAAVRLVVDNRGAVAPLNQTTAATQRLSVAAKGTTGALAGTSAATATLGSTMAATFAPIVALTAAVGFLGKSLKTAGDRAADINVLRKSLIALEGSARNLDKLNKIAEKLGKQTLFNEDDFRKGFNLLTSFKTIGVDSYERVTTAAADMGTKLNTDVRSNLLQLAKALEAPEVGLTALRRSGTRFTEQQTEQIKTLVKSGKLLEAQKLILEEIEAQ